MSTMAFKTGSHKSVGKFLCPEVPYFSSCFQVNLGVQKRYHVLPRASMLSTVNLMASPHSTNEETSIP